MPIVAPEAALRPPLKWAGGKRWQIPHLRPLWKPHAQRRLVEPFCGGLAVALGLAPATAFLNDANPHLINFCRWLQRGLRTDMPMENDEGMFYRHRERFNAILSANEGDSADAAALFYYLNRTGFNGLCRFNRQGAINVPFGQYARHRGPVVLVNQATSRVEALYQKLGYRVRFLEAPRRISCTGDRRPAREIIGTRNI
jgi:DNA adenine methylase